MGLRPQRKPKRLIEKGKKIEPFVTPEAKRFRKETGKLDRWIYQKPDIREYFVKKGTVTGGGVVLIAVTVIAVSYYLWKRFKDK